MEVKLEHYTPLNICSKAIRTCWDSHKHSDTTKDIECGEKDKELVDRIGNKLKHESVKNHITYNFTIKGISTKTLLALTRHDVGVEFSVQSTRYTTKKVVKSGDCSYTLTKNETINNYLADILEMIKDCVNKNFDNDDISMLLPQAWHYNLFCSMSLQAVQHLGKLRLKSDAHWDIRKFTELLFLALPDEHKYLFEDIVVGVSENENFKEEFLSKITRKDITNETH